MTDISTLPRLLRRNATEMADRPAIREKNHGIWQTFNWAQYWEQVRDFALGLAAHGFRRGDKLAVIGDNRPRLYWSITAAQCVGGVPVPVYQDAVAAEMRFVLDHAEVPSDRHKRRAGDAAVRPGATGSCRPVPGPRRR